MTAADPANDVPACALPKPSQKLIATMSLTAPAPHTALPEPADAGAFYADVLRLLAAGGTPFLVGGALALSFHTGMHRPVKDLDLFVRQGDWPLIERTLRDAGHDTELTYPYWLGKARSERGFVDLIFSSGNGLCPVDDSWFERAGDAELYGQAVRVVSAEESIWTKAFVMERERYDGADVAHLMLSCARRLDWQHLRRRFGPHWRVLFSYVVLFGFIYPGESHLVPGWLVDEMCARLRRQTHTPPETTRICAGTLLSREQYLEDVDRLGFIDARLTSASSMTPDEIAHWTRAIGQ
jgi:hypothetical protein